MTSNSSKTARHEKLIGAIENGKIELVADMLKRYDRILHEEPGELALHCAARHGHVKLVELILAHGANIEADDEHGRTAMVKAVMADNALEVVDVLLKNGAPAVSDPPRNRDTEWKTPMWLAAEMKKFEVVKKLLQVDKKTLSWVVRNCKRTDGPSSKDVVAAKTILEYKKSAAKDLLTLNKEGQTPVVRAAESMHSELVPLLLERQDPIPISKIKTTGWQSLHWAARYGRLDIVRLMVTQGADVFAKDSEGHLPADIARHTKPESIEMLEWLSPPKVDVYEDQHLAPDLTRPRADIAVNDMCKNALVHVVGLYPTCVIQKSEFSVYNFLYEYGPERIMTAVSAAKRIDEPLDFSADAMDPNEDARDLRQAINDHMVQEKDRLPRELGVHAVIMPILGVCVRKTVEWGFGPNKERLLSAFGKTIAQAEVAEVRLFDEFETHLQSYDNPLPKDKRQFNGGILPEIKLLKEIKDVLDELSIIETVFRSQRLVIQDAINFFRRMHSLDSDFAEFGNYYEAFSKLDVAVTELDKLKDAAKQTHANI
ncbi:hypothetical protein SLS63_007227 [Diaporthe eres]|uniref:Ankyrin repeat protein n=1 Tax=Diaporthe eres TaxID=83184 RepID=A0ABR1P5S3_DIAER